MFGCWLLLSWKRVIHLEDASEKAEYQMDPLTSGSVSAFENVVFDIEIFSSKQSDGNNVHQ
jgi:hypothetical protein